MKSSLFSVMKWKSKQDDKVHRKLITTKNKMVSLEWGGLEDTPSRAGKQQHPWVEHTEVTCSLSKCSKEARAPLL